MKHSRKIIYGIIIVIILIGIGNASKNKNRKPKPIPNNPSVTQQPVSLNNQSQPTKRDIVLRNVSYGPDKRNTMDIFVPKGSDHTTPFVLFIHGGAWVFGDKKDMTAVQAGLGAMGIASASMNYRYASNTIHYPELMNDVDRAVQHVVTRGKDWNISTEKIAIGGISAGGHMALLYAYRYDKENHISSVISLAGPTKLDDVNFLNGATLLQLIEGANKIAGATYQLGKPISSQFIDASPLYSIKNVPTLLIHGTKDMVVPYTHAELLANALKQKNYTYDLMMITGANHDIGLGNKATAKQILDRVTDWVREHGK